MGKFYGRIGYVVTEETSPGIWTERITERNYFGEETRNTNRLESSVGTNDNINISNELSIVADPYAYENFHAMRYVEFMGALWKINSAEVKRPRILLRLGGVYNGGQA